MVKKIEKLNQLGQNIIDYILDDTEDINCIVFNTNIIDSGVECLYEEHQLVEESLKSDFDYKYLMKTEEDKENYIESNFTDRLFELITEPIGYVYKKIIEDMKKEGYEAYEGDFFPYNGNFKNLGADQVAFLK